MPAAGVDDAALAALATPVLAVRFARDQYVPVRSFDVLLDKLPQARIERLTFGAADFARERPDHFGWMREPAAVAEAISRWVASTRRPEAVSAPVAAC